MSHETNTDMVMAVAATTCSSRRVLKMACEKRAPGGDKVPSSRTRRCSRSISPTSWSTRTAAGKPRRKAQYIANVMKGPSHYQSMTESDTRVRIYGKTAVLWGLVDVQPAKGDLYRVRTLEVYTQNRCGRLADDSEGIRARSIEVVARTMSTPFFERIASCVTPGSESARPFAAAALLTMSISTGFVSAQEGAVRINGAIDKLARGKSLAGAIMYDFSLYAAAQFASSDLDFIIIDMEHRGLDFERLETFLLGTTNKAEIAKQGNLQVRVPPIVRIPTYGRAPNEAIVKQVLDMGAFGIMFPAIENKEQALAAVRASRYPQLKGAKYPEPAGLRGNGNMPAAWFWGLSGPNTRDARMSGR